MATYFHIANLSSYLLWNTFCKIFASRKYTKKRTIISPRDNNNNKNPIKMDTNHYCRFMKKDWIWKHVYLFVCTSGYIQIGFSEASWICQWGVPWIIGDYEFQHVILVNSLIFIEKKSAHLYNSHPQKLGWMLSHGSSPIYTMTTSTRLPETNLV